MASPEDLAGAPLSLYEARRGVYPKRVDGFYRRMKWAIMGVTLAIYYGCLLYTSGWAETHR